MPSFKDLVASTNFFKFQHNKVPLQGLTKQMLLQVSMEQNNHGGVMLVYHLISQIVSLAVLLELQTNKNLRF
jgi:polyhydroxyalkanoate synthesis regulator protein